MSAELLALADEQDRHAERLPGEAAKMLRHYTAKLRALAGQATGDTFMGVIPIVENKSMLSNAYAFVAPGTVTDVAWECLQCPNLNTGERCVRCGHSRSGRITGFVMDGLNPSQLVRKLSECNQLTNVLSAAAELYGFELVIDDEVATQLRACESGAVPEVTYAHEYWVRKPDGEVVRERRATKDIPDWVVETALKWGVSV